MSELLRAVLVWSRASDPVRDEIGVLFHRLCLQLILILLSPHSLSTAPVLLSGLVEPAVPSWAHVSSLRTGALIATVSQALWKLSKHLLIFGALSLLFTYARILHCSLGLSSEGSP